MSRKQPRSLRPDERALWDRVRKTATPLRPDRPAGAGKQAGATDFGKTPPARAASASPAVSVASLRPFSIGELAKTAHGPTDRHTAAAQVSQPVRMEKKRFSRMKRGKLAPEARLDLHGMTLSQAQPALVGFVMRAQAGGLRLVLVITGKGRKGDDGGPVPARRGILRHHVPQWLGQPPLSAAVLQVSPSHPRHGGDGAFYVYLRRRR